MGASFTRDVTQSRNYTSVTFCDDRPLPYSRNITAFDVALDVLEGGSTFLLLVLQKAVLSSCIIIVTTRAVQSYFERMKPLMHMGASIRGKFTLGL